MDNYLEWLDSLRGEDLTEEEWHNAVSAGLGDDMNYGHSPSSYGPMTTYERAEIVSAFIWAAEQTTEVLSRSHVVSERVNRVGEFTTQLRRRLTAYGGGSAKRFAHELTKPQVWYDVLSLNEYYPPNALNDLSTMVEEALDKLNGEGPEGIRLGLGTAKNLCKDCRVLDRRMGDIIRRSEEVLAGFDRFADEMRAS